MLLKGKHKQDAPNFLRDLVLLFHATAVIWLDLCFGTKISCSFK